MFELQNIIQMLLMGLLGGGIGVIAQIVFRNFTHILLKRRNIEEVCTKLDALTFVFAFFFDFLIGAFVSISIVWAYYFIIVAVLIELALIDWHYRKLPNDYILILIAVRLVFMVIGMLGVDCSPLEFDWYVIIGSLVAGFACLIVFCIPAFFGSSIGMGDVKLMGAVGLMLGLSECAFAVGGMGVLFALITIVGRNGVPFAEYLKTKIPMGPVISISTIFTMIGFAIYIYFQPTLIIFA